MKEEIADLLMEGTVIPAHPLALTKERELDVFYQRLLTKYYIEAGAGGIAVGVHTTQFEIRDPKYDLYTTVLRLASEEVEAANLKRPFLRIAGVSGPTEQGVKEAIIARDLGYDIVLVSMNGLGDWSEAALIERARSIGVEIPIFGFYLQPAVGGKVLSYDFWRRFAELTCVKAIKMAPFNRYQTLDVVQAVCHSSRCEEIALYTGNDDNIFNDLLTTYELNTSKGVVKKDIVGGLLGHWAVWTNKAVQLLEEVKEIKKKGRPITAEELTLGLKITDSNAAFFDARNNFDGCIAGIHEVLRRQGLMKGIWCLNPTENLSLGQQEEIDRVYVDYPSLNDDAFVKSFLTRMGV
ncbi:MAG: dihydrodipicolinate synthase/N-acetylneuraminate lyase [Saprospiraceae bacterium]|jgi:dihydrodipicolinate synthase/N-acetylneuraminate lyase